MDMEENIPSDIQITQYFTLFITEFLFTFICGFCEFDQEKKLLKTNFNNFDNFSIFTLEFLSSKFTNILSIFDIAQKKISFVQTDCEKTEYVLTDKFNAYGVYFLVLLAFNYSNNKNLLNALNKETKSSYMPKIFSKEYYSMIILDILKNIVSIESRFSEKGHLAVFFNQILDSNIESILHFFQRHIRFYDPSRSSIEDMKNKNKLDKKIEYIDSSYSKYFTRFILEYLRLSREERDKKLLASIAILYDVPLYNLIFN